MRGGEEDLRETEESGAVLDVEDRAVEHGVEPVVEVRVVEVVVLDENEEAVEGEEAQGPTPVDPLAEPVGRSDGAPSGHVRQDLVVQPDKDLSRERLIHPARGIAEGQLTETNAQERGSATPTASSIAPSMRS